MDARPATLSMAAWFRASDAFISTTVHPISAAMASAAVVLPTPGGPVRIAARRAGTRPAFQLSAHDRSSVRALGFPRISLSRTGRSLSASGSRWRAAQSHGTGRAGQG